MTPHKRWWTESLGRIELQIPEEAIEACSHQGDCFDDVEHWVPKIDWTGITRMELEASLKEYGAWEDLHEVDDITLKQRVLWNACHDLSEEDEDTKQWTY